MPAPKRNPATKRRALTQAPVKPLHHRIDLYQTSDGRWVADSPGNPPKVPGVQFNGASEFEALAKLIEFKFPQQ